VVWGRPMGSGSKRRWRAAGIAAGIALAVAYGDDVQRNVNGEARAQAACGKILAGMDQRMKPEARAPVVDDPRALVRDLRDEMEAPCVALAPRLRWWQWNYGATMTVPIDPGRNARLDAARRTMLERCPAVMRKTIGSVNIFGTLEDAEI